MLNITSNSHELWNYCSLGLCFMFADCLTRRFAVREFL